MKLKLVLPATIALCLLSTPFLVAQENFRVMFYNVENLFDCEHDSLKNDEEFLPDAARAWHYGRYKDKLAKISQVISAVGEWDAPALVGVCEVENDRTMRDLTQNSPLKYYQYQYVMTDSPDERGIDVALLWQRDRFRMLSHQAIRVNFEDESRRPTRDILHVTGLIQTGDSLDVFVCHLPSRGGGVKESEPARVFATSLLKQAVDSLYALRASPNILIMGDFNDYPTDISIVEGLGAKAPEGEIDPLKLYNLMADKGGDIGTYNYRGEWGILDHLIVSGHLLLNTNGFHTANDKTHIASFSFLKTEDEKYGGMRPYRTYYGVKYVGGYSDHFPVYVDFVIP